MTSVNGANPHGSPIDMERARRAWTGGSEAPREPEDTRAAGSAHKREKRGPAPLASAVTLGYGGAGSDGAAATGSTYQALGQDCVVVLNDTAEPKPDVPLFAPDPRYSYSPPRKLTINVAEALAKTKEKISSADWNEWIAPLSLTERGMQDAKRGMGVFDGLRPGGQGVLYGAHDQIRQEIISALLPYTRTQPTVSDPGPANVYDAAFRWKRRAQVPTAQERRRVRIICWCSSCGGSGSAMTLQALLIARDTAVSLNLQPDIYLAVLGERLFQSGTPHAATKQVEGNARAFWSEVGVAQTHGLLGFGPELRDLEGTLIPGGNIILLDSDLRTADEQQQCAAVVASTDKEHLERCSLTQIDFGNRRRAFITEAALTLTLALETGALDLATKNMVASGHTDAVRQLRFAGHGLDRGRLAAALAAEQTAAHRNEILKLLTGESV